MGSGLYEWVIRGIGLILALQAIRLPWLDGLFTGITFLGNTEFYLLLVPMIYWLFDKNLGRRLAYLVIISGAANEFAKNSFKLPRPFHADSRVIPVVTPEGYGLPSGHTMLPTILWGYLGWHWRHKYRWAIPLLVILVALIAFSRLYLGVHFPADVIVGFGLGVLILIAWIALEKPVAAWLSTLSAGPKTAIFVILPLLLIALTPAGPHGYPAEATVTISGLLLGMNFGFWAEQRQVNFQVAGNWRQKVIRYLLGLVVIGLFWFGLRVLFGLLPLDGYGVMVLRLIRYSLVGLALAWWTPWLFVKLGLAKTKN